MKDLILDNKIVLIGLFTIIILITSFFCINYFSEKENKVVADAITNVEVNETTNKVSNKFYVDVKGSVKKPGVYEVEEGSIINDAIKLAGGLKSDATTKNINLSKKLTSEMVVYVFSKKDFVKTTTASIVNESTICKTEVIEVNNCPKDDTVKESENISKKVNINTASKEELMTLNSIGSSKADSIIIYRNEKKFETIEDIKNVSGIGDSLFDKIKDNITVE